jgi:hypothetical protein
MTQPSVALITAMLAARSPATVLPLAQSLPEPPAIAPDYIVEEQSKTKANALAAVAVAFAQQGDPVQGRTVLEQAIAKIPLTKRFVGFNQPLDPNGPLLPPTQIDINNSRAFPLLWRYARTGESKAALEIAQGTRSPILVMALKAVIASDYTRQGETALAQTLMDEVKTQIRQAPQDQTYPVVGLVFAELMAAQQYQLAWDLLQAIDVHTWTVHFILLSPSSPLDLSFLNEIHDWQAEIIQAAIADQHYDIALAAARDHPRLLQMATLAHLDASLDANRVAAAMAAARRAEITDRAEVLAAIALKLEQHNQLDLAQAAWTEALNTAQNLKDGRERAEALLTVAAPLQHSRRRPQIDAFLKQVITIDAAYKNSNSYQYAPVLHRLIEFPLLESQETTLAHRLVDAMPPGLRRDRHRLSLFQGLLSYHYEQIPVAETVLAQLPNSAFRVRSQIALAEAHFTWGQFERSAAILNQAQRDLQQLSESQILQARRTTEPYSFFEDNAIPWLTPTDSRSTLLGYLALGHAKLQNQNRARLIVQMIPNRQLRGQWRSHLACYRP